MIDLVFPEPVVVPYVRSANGADTREDRIRTVRRFFDAVHKIGDSKDMLLDIGEQIAVLFDDYITKENWSNVPIAEHCQIMGGEKFYIGWEKVLDWKPAQQIIIRPDLGPYECIVHYGIKQYPIRISKGEEDSQLSDLGQFARYRTHDPYRRLRSGRVGSPG